MTIPAGGSLAVNHTVSALYDFETAGAGTYTFSPRADWVVSEEGASHTLLPISEAISVEIEITEDVAQRPVFPPLNQLSTPVCNDANRKNFIAAALSEARALAGGAAADIRSRPNSAQYTSYFNNNNRDDVWYNFDRIAGDLASSGSRRCVTSRLLELGAVLTRRLATACSALIGPEALAAMLVS